jgi:hypothetical protein
MSRNVRLLMILLSMLASIGASSAAEDGLPEETPGWIRVAEQPAIAEPIVIAPIVAEEPLVPISIQHEAGSETLLPQLPPLEENFEFPMVEAPPEVFEEAVSGRHYNDAGWFSKPNWGSMTWRPGSGGDFGEFGLAGAVASPVESWKGLSFTQRYGYHFLDGPTRTDMPPRVFDFNWGLHWFGEISDNWWVDLAFSAGLYTDFEDSAREGWRFPSHAVLSWAMTQKIQPVVGVRYFDRDNLGLLPVAGVILRPDDGIRIELVYPEPKIARRVSTDGDQEHWMSIAGRIGGGEWAIERDRTGLADVVTYTDYELVLGFDTIDNAGSISSFEIGYGFDRDLEYRSRRGNTNLPETFFLRWVTRK